MTLDELKEKLKQKSAYIEIDEFNQEENGEPYQITYTIYLYKYDDDPDPIHEVSIDDLDNPKDIEWVYNAFKKYLK